VTQVNYGRGTCNNVVVVSVVDAAVRRPNFW